jgi:hypothetical protein
MTKYGSCLGRYVPISGLCLLTVGIGLCTGRPLSAETEYKKILNADIHQLCMDVRREDDYNAAGARVQQWDCTGTPQQQWHRTYVGDLYNVPDLYTIRSERSNMCLDESHLISAIPGVDPSNGTGVQIAQFPCVVAQSQNWIFKSTGEIVNQVSGMCLDTTASSRGSMIMQWPCNGNTAQRWFW